MGLIRNRNKGEECRKNMKEPKKVDKKVFSFFILIFPSILIAVNAKLFPEAWLINLALIFLQSILLKKFLDDYYPEVEGFNGITNKTITR